METHDSIFSTKKFIYDILINKNKIFGIVIWIIIWIKEADAMMEYYIKNYLMLLIALFFILIIILAHFFYSRKKNLYIKKANEVKTNSKSILWSGFTIMAFILIIFTVSALIYLQNAPVYFIRIGDYGSQAQINKKAIFINKSFENQNVDLIAVVKKRSKIEKDANYFLCINGGYVVYKRALVDLNRANKILKNMKISLNPLGNKNISVLKKMEYLNWQIQNNFKNFD